MSLGDLGQAVLWLALALAIAGAAGAAAVGWGGGWKPVGASGTPGATAVPAVPALLESARNAAFGTAALAVLAATLLVSAFLGHDFSLRYVALNSTRDAPLAVTLTGFWGGQAGSLLFWACGLTLLTVLVTWREFHAQRPLMPWVLATLLGIQAFFFLILAAVASPFEQLPMPPADGRGLNPLLWDDGMRVHPPLLLTGYMSFSAPFAFAIAALAAGGSSSSSSRTTAVAGAPGWLPAVRRWMLLAWTIQGAGLIAGAWWAYHVLGWGGYWGWDPVENVALLPWLTATAFLHSLMVQERRGMLKVWNVSLVLASFCLAIFGTFIVRSGVLGSVHSFAQSSIGPYFFGFLALVAGGSLALLFGRLPRLQAETQFESLLSREAAFLVNNLLLVVVAAATFWGTVFPLVAELATGAKVSVGAPFFERVNGPVLLAVLVLMGAGPLLPWRRTTLPAYWRSLRLPLSAACLATAVLFAAGVRQGLALLALAAAAFAAGSIAWELVRALGAPRRLGIALPAALALVLARNRRRYGGYLVHLGMVCIALGVIGSRFYQTEVVATLAPGESLVAGRYRLEYGGLAERRDPGVQVVDARVQLWRDDRPLGELRPERRIHRGWEQQPVTGVALRTLLPSLDDVYVMLAGWDDGGVGTGSAGSAGGSAATSAAAPAASARATLRVFVNPLVSLVWVGGAIFLLGSLMAAWPSAAPARAGRTARVSTSRESAPAVASAA